MVIDELRRQEAGVFGPIVAFDFDGTLTWRDSFLAFLRWRVGAVRYASGMLRLAPATAAFGINRDRGRLKAAMVREFLRDAARTDLLHAADRFASEHARHLLRPDALRRWELWQSHGARLVIVTASPEILVAPFARGLGADRLIGTRLAFDDSDRVSGDLDGPNCRGPEKVVRLKAAFGNDVRLEAAYGDSDGDIEMLAIADEPGMKVFGDRP